MRLSYLCIEKYWVEVPGTRTVSDERGRIGQKEKLNCDAITARHSADP